MDACQNRKPSIAPDFTPVSEGVLRWSAFLKSFLALGDWSQSFHFISSVSLAVSLFNIIGTFLNGAQLSRLLLPHCTHGRVEDVTSIMVARYSLCSVNLKGSLKAAELLMEQCSSEILYLKILCHFQWE